LSHSQVVEDLEDLPTLYDFLQNPANSLTWLQTLTIITEITSAVAFMHAKGVLLRDLRVFLIFDSLSQLGKTVDLSNSIAWSF
jgi:serine/threonine protein kinase